MIRNGLLSALVVFVVATTGRAETYGEKLTAVDVDKKTITFVVEGKEKTFKVDDKVSVQSQVRVGKRLRLTPVRDGIKGVKAGTEATVTTEKRDGIEIVTKIVVLVPEKK